MASIPTVQKGSVHPFRIMIRALIQLLHHEGPQGAAAISYFSLFSLFPLMLVLLATTDWVLYIFGARDAVMRSLMQLFPGARQFLQAELMELGAPSRELVITCVFLFLWSSSWMFDFLESTMNRAWQVSRRRGFFHSRLLSVWVIFLFVLLFLLSTTLTVVVTQVADESLRKTSDYFTPLLLSAFWHGVLLASGLLVTSAVFTLLYLTVPYTRVRFRYAFDGAFPAALLWQAASYLFAILVPHLDYQLIYGSIGAVVALLTWVYVSSIIVLWGNHYAAMMQAARSAGHD
jgi:membrane protein